jgi:hypothetical protein
MGDNQFGYITKLTQKTKKTLSCSDHLLAWQNKATICLFIDIKSQVKSMNAWGVLPVAPYWAWRIRPNHTTTQLSTLAFFELPNTGVTPSFWLIWWVVCELFVSVMWCSNLDSYVPNNVYQFFCLSKMRIIQRRKTPKFILELLLIVSLYIQKFWEEILFHIRVIRKLSCTWLP